jgi:hypothetical protein
VLGIWKEAVGFLDLILQCHEAAFVRLLIGTLISVTSRNSRAQRCLHVGRVKVRDKSRPVIFEAPFSLMLVYFFFAIRLLAPARDARNALHDDDLCFNRISRKE